MSTLYSKYADLKAEFGVCLQSIYFFESFEGNLVGNLVLTTYLKNNKI